VTGMFVLLLFIIGCFLPKIRRMSRLVRDALGEVSATVTEHINIHDLIRSFSKEETVDRKVDSYSYIAQKKQEHLIWRQSGLTDLMQILIVFIAPLLLLFIASRFLIEHDMTNGQLVTFYGYWIMMGGTIRMITHSFPNIFSGLASADRIFDFFDEQALVKDKDNARDMSEAKGKISFESVTFRYPREEDKIVLDNFSMHVQAGKKIGLVGPSGAGKSTILSLIMRFYDPDSGIVRIDDQDLKDYKQKSVRNQLGIVMQESMFFAGTIAENLRLAKDDATKPEMRRALENANAMEFVNEMPDNPETVLGERGVKLSGGQKQRLSIARVFLRDPPILLFDEATSSLDSISEKLVQEAMNRLMAGRTAIIIAHRISTIINADEIFVLENGKIAQTGTHKDLLKNNVLYRELCRQQGISE